MNMPGFVRIYRLFISSLVLLVGILIGGQANAQTGVGPYALDFDGVNDHVDLGNKLPAAMLSGGSFDNGDVDQSWTFEAYVKIPQNPTDPETLFSVNPSITSLPFLFNQDRLGLVIDDNPNQQGCRFRYYQEYQILPPFPFQGQNVVNFNKDITDGEWHHIALTYAYDDQDFFIWPYIKDPAHIDVKLYVDGKLVGAFDEASLSTNVQIQNQDYITLGSDYNGFRITNGFSGKMDEVRIWGDVRTPSEVRNTKGKTLTGTESDLVGYYPFNQQSGINAPDIAGGVGDGTLDNINPKPSWFTSYTIFTWEGTVDSNWNNGDNWRFGGVPKSRDRVYLPSAPNPPSKTNNSSETVEVLNVGDKASPMLGNDVIVRDSLILNSVLEMKSSTLVIADDAVVRPEGGAPNQYVKGTVKKVGDDAFDFPVGAKGNRAKIGISGPANTSAAFEATYFDKGPDNADSIAGSHPAGKALKSVSQNRYWDLERVNGTSAVDVTLYWNDQINGDITNKNALVVAHENANNKWENLGKDTSSGQVSGSGSITKNSVNNFSDLTYGSTSASQPLPVELLYFRATANKRNANLSWATASETNNRHFRVQKRVNGQWENIGTVKGQGTTIEKQTYEFRDAAVRPGRTYYYRLKQVDFDGSFEYANIESVTLQNQEGNSPITLYPNPAKHQLYIQPEGQLAEQNVRVTIYNSRGQEVHRDRLNFKGGKGQQQLSVEPLKPGAYILILQGPTQTYRKRFIKQE